MRRVLVPLIAAAALALSACTGGSAPDAAEPRAVFPSPSQPTFATGRDAVAKVVDRVLPSVVNVVSEFSGGEGEGTGFVVRSDGIIVTNYHVVEGASKVTVLTSAKDPVHYDARVIGGDVEADLAVLDVDATDLPTVPLGDSADLVLGQQVVAIGYALGLAGGPSVTSGVVSSLTRRITVPDSNCRECPNGQRIYTQVVQTDAAINPGNSGGPLVDMAGQVVGINTAGANTAENIAFAIQIDAVEPIIFQAAENPSAPVAFMGITSADASDPSIQFELDPPVTEGAVIIGVVQGGPADDAGIRQGDVVVVFDDQPVDSAGRLGELIRARKPGDEVSVGLVHPDGSREVVTVVLGVNPVATA
jgi:putative serine protease PepD